MDMKMRLLAKLENPYSIALLPWQSSEVVPGFVAGSEGTGALICCEPPDFAPRVIADTPGGFITVCPIAVGDGRYLIAAADFRPGFKAENCRIYVYPLEKDIAPVPAQVAKIPFAHRIAIVEVGGKRCFLASTLCAAKSSSDDWTQPGGIHLAVIPDALSSEWPLRQIVRGLNKNHGMVFARLDGQGAGGFILAANEGLFYLRVPKSPDGEWPLERIAEGGHSDAYSGGEGVAANDGVADIFAISPFHGNVLSVYRRSGETWERSVICEDLNFGHVVWAGQLLGQPVVIAGSRQGRRELRLFRAPAKGLTFTEMTLEEGVDAAQIAVVNKDPKCAHILATARGKGGIVMYTINALE